MRSHTLLWPALALAALTSSAAASLFGESEPDIAVAASFPEDNPFGQIVNGERNRINLLVENKSDLNVTLVAVAGSFHDADTEALVKNTTTLSYGLLLLQGTKLQIPYQFHSEFKPGDIKLHVWLTHTVNDKVYQVTAYDGIVTVVEPEVSIFNYQVVSTYLLTGAFLVGLGYVAFRTFAPQTKPRRARRQPVSAPVTVTATGAGGYEEEWIPAHHLKTRGARAAKAAGAAGASASAGATSASSADEQSGPEGRRRKGRK